MRWWLLVILAGLVVGYLYSIYHGYYDFLGKVGLQAPVHQEKTIVNPGQKTAVRLVTLGDSLSSGVGASDYEHSFPVIIAQNKFGDSTVELVNLAIPGAGSSDVINDQIPLLPKDKIDAVTLLVGVNDIHNFVNTSEFERNYRKIVTEIHKTEADIYLLNIPYLGSRQIVRFPFDYLLNWRTRQFNSIIKKIADEEKVKYVDLYNLRYLEIGDFYSSDLFHPSDNGYKSWLKAF